MKALICILSTFFTVCCFQVKASDSFQNQIDALQKEIEVISQEKTTDKHEMRASLIKANINYLECTVLRKIERLEQRVRNYKGKLQNIENGSEAHCWLKKIEAAEKKISRLNEVAFSINLLKTRINF